MAIEKDMHVNVPTIPFVHALDGVEATSPEVFVRISPQQLFPCRSQFLDRTSKARPILKSEGEELKTLCSHHIALVAIG